MEHFIKITNLIGIQVLLIARLQDNCGSTITDCVIVQWYDSCAEETLWDCQHLMLIDKYSAIPIGSVDHSVHIIPRYGHTNKYLVN